MKIMSSIIIKAMFPKNEFVQICKKLNLNYF
jgi:hypothetical protein